MKLKCSHKGCNEEGTFRVGDLKHAKVLCIKHYAAYLKKKANSKGSVVWGGME